MEKTQIKGEWKATMKKIAKTLLISVLVSIVMVLFSSCKNGFNIERQSKDMFPKMTKLEVFNGGQSILFLEVTDTSHIEIRMSSVSNHNGAGRNFYLERYDVYIDNNYITTIIDSEAMAFVYTKKE